MSARRVKSWLTALTAATSLCSGFAVAGTPTQQLQQEWWQWLMSIPSSDSPVYDKTGNRCGIAQRGATWFLAGSTGGKITRKCTVPSGVSLLVPVVNNFCFPDAAYTDAACTADTIAFIDGFSPSDVVLTVDGVPQPMDRITDEDDFSFAVGFNGYGGVKPGIYRATVADGYWGLVGPLSAGSHTIHISAQSASFGLDVTYVLEVVESRN